MGTMNGLKVSLLLLLEELAIFRDYGGGILLGLLETLELPCLGFLTV